MTTPESDDDKVKSKIDAILGYKNLIDNFPDNDFFLFPFMSMVLDLTDKKGFLTEAGMKLLHNDIVKDIEILKENGDKPSQYALTRLALWYCLSFNLLQFFCGFIFSLEEEATKVYASQLPAELKEYLKTIADRGALLIEPISKLAGFYTNQLTDKFAKVFDEEKRKCWTKDLFNNTVHIPAHPNDLPEGFDIRNSREVK